MAINSLTPYMWDSPMQIGTCLGHYSQTQWSTARYAGERPFKSGLSRRSTRPVSSTFVTSTARLSCRWYWAARLIGIVGENGCPNGLQRRAGIGLSHGQPWLMHAFNSSGVPSLVALKTSSIWRDWRSIFFFCYRSTIGSSIDIKAVYVKLARKLDNRRSAKNGLQNGLKKALFQQ
jgi:hypothetical protein